MPFEIATEKCDLNFSHHGFFSLKSPNIAPSSLIHALFRIGFIKKRSKCYLQNLPRRRVKSDSHQNKAGYTTNRCDYGAACLKLINYTRKTRYFHDFMNWVKRTDGRTDGPTDDFVLVEASTRFVFPDLSD